MIDVKELRIGNYVVRKNNESEQLIVDIDLFVKISRHPVFFDPISITEELIIKCGFEEIKAHDNFRWYILNINEENYNLPFFYFNCGENFVSLCNPDSEQEIIKITSLHQLQNIYWCLCGKEFEMLQ